jgi:hypothetical protein
MFQYLLQRIAHFVALAGPAGNQSPLGLGRSNPWVSTSNLLAERYFESADRSDASAPIKAARIWGFDDSKWVFYSGVTNSMLERNLAQGISLLSDFNWDPTSYETTVSVRKLETISGFARKIAPPVWPSSLGAPDPAKADRGKALFEVTCNCVGCHAASPAQGPGSSELHYPDVGTDPSYVEAQRRPVAGRDYFSVLADWMGAVKASAYQREGVTPAEQASLERGRTPVQWRGPTRAPDGQPWNGIEAKPLHGIWASPPYLHNGSVASVRQLLTPPAQRLASFFVGEVEYDPHDLGFVNREVRYPGYEAASLRDTRLSGNGNGGHDFCTGLREQDKDDLIEFLKTY